MIRDLHREFMRVTALPPEERAQAIDRLGTNDPELASELRALLTLQTRTTELPNNPGALMGTGGHSLRPHLFGLEGTRIGAYELTRVVGEGGSGVVYEARQTEPLDRTVAVKLLDPAFAEIGLLAGMEAEHRFLARLDHPGIVTVFDAGVWRHPEVDRDVPFVVTELINGTDCLSAFVSQHWSLPRVLQMVRSVVEAVAYAHRAGIVHRDLKPSNILLDADGRVRIIDFGIAATVGGDHAEPVHAGTHDFAAPETIAIGIATERSDVYSLGVLLTCLLQRTGPTPRMLRRDAETIAAACRHEDPTLRYPDASALLADLHNALARRPLSVARRPGWSAWHRFALRHRVAVAAACVVAVSLLATTVISVMSAAENKRAELAASWSRSVALHGTASMAIAAGQVSAARAALDDTPAEHRLWPWRHLDARSSAWTDLSAAPAHTIYSLAVHDSGAVRAIDEAGVLWSWLPGEPATRLAALPAAGHALLLDGNDVLVGTSGGVLHRVPASTADRASQSRTLVLPDRVLRLQHGPGDNVLAGLRDGSVMLIDYDAVSEWHRAESAVYAIAMHRTTGLVAIGNANGTLTLLDPSANALASVQASSGRIQTISFDASGDELILGTLAGELQRWDVSDPSSPALGREQSIERGVIEGCFVGGLYATGSLDGVVRFWSASLDELVSEVRGHTGPIYTLAALSDHEIVTGSTDRTMRTWDIRAASQHTRVSTATPRQPFSAICDPRRSIRKRSNALVLADGLSAPAKTIDMPGVDQFRILAGGSPETPMVMSEAETTHAMLLTPDAHLSDVPLGFRPHAALSTADNVIVVDRLGEHVAQLARSDTGGPVVRQRSWSELHEAGMLTRLPVAEGTMDTLLLPGSPRAIQRHADQVLAVPAAVSGTRAAVVVNQRVLLVKDGELKPWRTLREFPRHIVIHSVALHPDEDVLAIGTSDGSIQIVHQPTGDTLLNLSVVEEAAHALRFEGDALYAQSIWGTRYRWGS